MEDREMKDYQTFVGHPRTGLVFGSNHLWNDPVYALENAKDNPAWDFELIMENTGLGLDYGEYVLSEDIVD
jgi:hypothetical protein